MIKRTISIANPSFLKKKDKQLVIEFSELGKESASIPIEDIGILILDHYQISVTHSLLQALNENNAVIISCNQQHMPFGLMLPMFSHHAYTERIHSQLAASVPSKKNLWKQTIEAKIGNQAAVLEWIGLDSKRLRFAQTEVKSGDSGNIEGQAAAYYWKSIFSNDVFFTRHREGDAPNNLLNYGYAILRAVIARALVGSGLFLTVGIHHRNKYNPYCLADDIMEPYRPFVDQLVYVLMKRYTDIEELTTDIKKDLLKIPTLDVQINGETSPLMIAAGRTSASIIQYFEGSTKKAVYPEINCDGKFQPI